MNMPSFGDIVVALNNIAQAIMNRSDSSYETYVPPLAPSTGAYTSAGATGRYKEIGNKTVMVKITVTITFVGTGVGCVVGLPIQAQASNGFVFSGREDAISGKMLQARLINANTISIHNYDNSNPAANGTVFQLVGYYERI